MPAKSAKQQRFMAMCAHGGAAKKECPSQKVAKEFSHKPAGGYNIKDIEKAAKGK